MPHAWVRQEEAPSARWSCGCPHSRQGVGPGGLYRSLQHKPFSDPRSRCAPRDGTAAPRTPTFARSLTRVRVRDRDPPERDVRGDGGEVFAEGERQDVARVGAGRQLGRAGRRDPPGAQQRREESAQPQDVEERDGDGPGEAAEQQLVDHVPAGAQPVPGQAQRRNPRALPQRRPAAPPAPGPPRRCRRRPASSRSRQRGRRHGCPSRTAAPGTSPPPTRRFLGRTRAGAQRRHSATGADRGRWSVCASLPLASLLHVTSGSSVHFWSLGDGPPSDRNSPPRRSVLAAAAPRPSRPTGAARDEGTGERRGVRNTAPSGIPEPQKRP